MPFGSAAAGDGRSRRRLQENLDLAHLGDGEVDLAVAVQLGRGKRPRRGPAKGESVTSRKAPVPSPSRTVTPFEAGLATAMSGCRRYSKSATTTEVAIRPGREMGSLEAAEPVSEQDRDVGESSLATARSAFPSRFRSATASDRGPIVTGTLEARRNPPTPSPSRIESSLESPLATARSTLRSLLKSATPTDAGGFRPVRVIPAPNRICLRRPRAGSRPGRPSWGPRDPCHRHRSDLPR